MHTFFLGGPARLACLSHTSAMTLGFLSLTLSWFCIPALLDIKKDSKYCEKSTLLSCIAHDGDVEDNAEKTNNEDCIH